MTRKPRRGFTLMELIVAMAVVTIVAGVLFASLRTAFQARKSAEQTVEPVQRAAVAMEFLKRDLESALAPTGTLANLFLGTQSTDDRGMESDDVLFFAPVDAPPQASLQTDVRQVEYMVVRDGEEYLLVRRVTSNLLAAITPEPDEEILCRGVRSFSLQYYDGLEWTTEWDSTQLSNTLPAAVEVALELEPAVPGRTPLYVTRLIQLPCCVPTTQSSGTPTAGGTP